MCNVGVLFSGPQCKDGAFFPLVPNVGGGGLFFLVSNVVGPYLLIEYLPINFKEYSETYKSFQAME